MKIIRSRPGKFGRVILTVEVDANEEIVGIRTGAYYKLGFPVEDVMHSDVLESARLVTWCSVEQRWVE